MNIKSILSKAIQSSLLKNKININLNPLVERTTNNFFGDYQSNDIIKLSKLLKKNSCDLSKKIITKLFLKNMCNKIESSNKGFINFYLNNKWIENELEKVFNSSRLGVQFQKKQTIVVDYSSPNLAKEMHIGHLRSTIIGDSVVKILEFLGHNVIRTNHVGDWGSQFGMLLAFLTDRLQKNQYKKIQLNDLEIFYQKAKVAYEKDTHFAKKSKKFIVKLQKGNKYCQTIWKQLVNITINKNQEIYNSLNVSLKPEHTVGESFYRNMLDDIVNDLIQKKIAINVNNAVIVFLNEFKNRDGLPMGVIIKKKDGCYLYTTIDIACVKYRYEQLHADRILYYTDSRQKQHLEQVCIIAKKAGYIPNNFLLEHHTFGMVLSKNKRPFQTRNGNIIHLSSLINESKIRAKKIILQKKNCLSKNKINKLAKIIGIGAIKYADLSKNRTTDYIFDWNSMLKFEGNTAPYIQYAYVRIKSIFNKTKISITHFPKKLFIKNDIERKIAIKILQFEEVILQISEKGKPHFMCTYLYELSVLFSNFYEKHTILSNKNVHITMNRLKLLLLLSRILKQGLYLLGIDIIDKM